jgi:hypothetical protein
MAHGTPDWGITAGRATTYQLTDLGELGVRLGSPDRFDRRGDVVLIDSFEDYTQRYDTQLLGTGAKAYRTVRRAHSGAWSWFLQGGSDSTGTATLTASAPPIVRGHVGLECAFNLPGTISKFSLGISHFDGVNERRYRVRWRDSDNALVYATSLGGAEFQFATVDLPAAMPTWNLLKMVVNLDAGLYGRIRLNDTDYDLTLASPEVVADARAPRVDFTVSVFSRAGNNDSCYIDDLIITQNEPV